MNNELERALKEVVMDTSSVVFRHKLESTEENHERS
jgi:hypothetical protein